MDKGTGHAFHAIVIFDFMVLFFSPSNRTEFCMPTIQFCGGFFFMQEELLQIYVGTSLKCALNNEIQEVFAIPLLIISFEYENLILM